MLELRRKEIELLEKKYGEIVYGPNYEWILIKEYKLPDGWNRDITPIFIIIPSGYPIIPPDNFFVPSGFRLGSGAMPSNYSESKSHLNQQWGVFSFHVQKETWSPSADIIGGSNLLTFMLGVEKRLKEVN